MSKNNKIKKTTFEMEDTLHQRLCRHINKAYPTESYGKKKQVIEAALNMYLTQQETLCTTV